MVDSRKILLPGQGFSSLSRRGWMRLAGLLLCWSSLLLPALAQETMPPTAPAPPLWDTIAHILVNRWWTSGLLFFGCFCLFYEMLTPKTWGVAGNTGAVCVGTVFAANLAIKEAGWVGVLLLLLGLTLILLEVHVYPGFGAALAGFVVMFAGMFIALGGVPNAAFSLPITSLLMVVSGLAFLFYLPKSPAWKRMGQKIQQHHALNVAGLESNILSVDEMRYFGSSLFIGQRGKVLTPLRPTGTADFGGITRRVVTEGDFLEPGARIMVTRVEGDRIVVDPVPANTESPVVTAVQ